MILFTLYAKLNLFLEKIRLWIYPKVNPLYLQWAGFIGIVIAYIVFGLKHTYPAWAIMAIVGIDEILLIWVWNKTITAFVRNLAKKTVDLIILFGVIPLTWWWFNPQTSGVMLVGLLLNHFTEIQPKEVATDDLATAVVANPV